MCRADGCLVSFMEAVYTPLDACAGARSQNSRRRNSFSSEGLMRPCNATIALLPSLYWHSETGRH